MPDYTLSAKITGDSSGYQKAVDEADKSTEQFQKNTSSLGTRLSGVLSKGLKVAAGAIAGVSAALGAGAVAGIKYNASIEQYQTSFEVMTGSAEKAAEVVQKLKDLGAATPFELPDLAETTKLLMNYGFTADEAIDRMQMLGDISQGSADKMSRIAMAYGQMSSAGKVSLEDVKQMIEAGFNPLQEISESTGESMQSLYDRISAGTLSVDEITASMQRATSEGGKYYQSMQKQSQTISGMISTLKDNAQQLIGEVVQPLTESVGTQLLPAAISAIDELTNAFKTRGTQGLIEAGGKIISDIATGVTQALPGILSMAITIIQQILTSLTENMPQLLTAGGQILTTLLTGMTQLLPALGTFILTMFTTLYTFIAEQGPVLLEQGYTILKNLVDGIVQGIPEMLPKALEFIQNFADGIADAAPDIIQKGFNLLSELVDGIISALPILIKSVPQIITTFANIINDNFPTILMKGVELLGQLVMGILQAIPTLVANIPQIIEAIVSVITAYNWMSLGKNIIDFFAKGIKSMFGFVKSTAENLQKNLVSAVENLPSTLSNLGANAVKGLGNAIKGGISTVTSHAKSIVSRIKNAITSVNWGSLGRNIISGIANGILGGIGNIVDAATNAAQSAFDAACDFLGIHSPSRLFRDEVGENMALGMAIGFDNNIPVDDINHALDEAVGKISVHYTRAGRAINPVDTIVGTERISESYQADVSNIFEGMVIHIDNTTNLDGEPIYRKSADYTIRKIGNQQQAFRRSKGGLDYALA